ncbi:MAG: HK97 family phage prohead protease [bacterium]|nr:HK97 family phage prohead protease [bacterium]
MTDIILPGTSNIDCPFEIRAEGINEAGEFEGFGSTFGLPMDSYGDIMVQGAFKKTIQRKGRNRAGIMMLDQHNPNFPVGKWVHLEEQVKGLYVHGKVATETTRGRDVHILMKEKILKFLSIGYDTIKFYYDEVNKRRARFLEEVELWEISPVSFPANIRARITGVKSMIEQANTVRELETALRDSGFSNSEAQTIISLSKKALEAEASSLRDSSGKATLNWAKVLRTLEEIKNVI